MRAIQMARPEAGAAVYVDDLEVPTPGPGEVRVRIERTAICGTDRHIFHWDPSVAHMLAPPVVIGHEFCGYVDEAGSGTSGWQPGDYVSAEMHIVCHACRACRRGDFHVCQDTRIAGLHRDGTFAEFVVLPAENLVRLDPEVVTPDIGSFLDALGNAVHTVQSASGISGRHVLMSGYGAIGACAAAVVEFLGAESLTITEVQPAHLERARLWAAGLGGRVPVQVHDPATEGDALHEAVRERTGGGVDVVLEMSGAPSAVNGGLDLLYPGGEIMLLGIPSTADLRLADFSRNVIFKGLRMQGILGRRMFGTWDEMLSMLRNGLSVDHVVTHRLPLSGFHEGIRLLDGGEAHKVVLDPSH